MMNSRTPLEGTNGPLPPRSFLRRRLVASSVAAVALLCVFLFASAIPLFSPYSNYEMPDWLAASLLVATWLLPVWFSLRLDGLRRASLGQLLVVSILVLIFTFLFLLATMLLIVLVAEIL